MRKRKKNYLWKIGFLLFGLLFTLTNCEKENDLIPEDANNSISKTNISSKKTNNESNEIDLAKQWFEQNRELNEFTVFQYSKPIEWNDALISSKNGKTAIEIPISLQENFNIVHSEYKNLITYNRLLIIKSKDGTFKSFIVNFLILENSNKFKNHFNTLNYFKIPKDYNGYISVIDNKNSVIQKKKFEKGKAINSKKTKSISNKGETQTYICIWQGWWYSDGTFEPTYFLGCYSESGASDGPISPDEYPADDSPDHGSPNNDTDPNGCGPGTTIGPDGYCIPIPTKIIDSLTGKADCVYNKMVDNNNNINWILENFIDGNSPSQFDLVLKMSTSLDNLTNASTATPKQSGIRNTFVISINSNTLTGRTSLGLARTIIHEGIHARLWEFMYSRDKNLAIISNDFPGIYDYYKNHQQNWDHEQMADFYRSTIAKGLKQFDNGQHSDSFYNALAWEGLAEIKDANNNHESIYTQAWEKLTLAEQTTILQIITDEKKSGNKECL